jgi:hypothetical protein
MADYNPADNLSDEDRQRGGQNSPGQFGKEQGADPHKAGQKGAANQSTADKAKGGHRSHEGGGNNQ